MKKISELFVAEASSPSETSLLHNGSVGFRIPEYQRQYDWSRENIQRLFYDCLSGFYRLSTSPHADAFTFLGTLILVDEKQKEVDFTGNSVAVVDGQQRLTTVTLFACALYERLFVGLEQLRAAALDKTALDWLELESDERLAGLMQCVVGHQQIRGHKTFPFPRIIRSNDQRGRSPQTSEYRSPIGRLLYGFAEYGNQEELTEFVPPALGNGTDAVRLGENFRFIRDLVANLNNADWYADTECEQVEIGWLPRAGYQSLFERLDDVIKGDSAQGRTMSDIIKCSQVHDFVRTLLFAAYFSRCVVLTRVRTDDESAAFDIFDALNTTGEPLTALETLKPRVIQFENTHGGYSGSASEAAFVRIKECIDDVFGDTAKKQSETKDLIVGFALYIEGAKLPLHLAAQRNFLRTRYDKSSGTSRQNGQRFVRSLADMAEFRHYYGTKEGIEELARFHPAHEVDEIQLLASFIRDTKTKLALPILARYWSPQLKGDGGGDFLAAIRAVAAFLALRRAASGGTAGIDSDFRAIMAPKNGSSKRFGLSAGVEADIPVLSISDLRTAFRTLLASSRLKIQDRDKWIAQVVDNPLYSQSKELARFMLLVAANHAKTSEAEPGCWTKDGVKVSAHINNFLDYKTWTSDLYATVEHIAPDSEQAKGWDQAIYANTILRHSLGNLVLLPQKENGAIGNDSWARKRVFYMALTEETKDGQDKRLEEAKAMGLGFTKYTTEIVQSGTRLSLLDPLRDLTTWNRGLIESRARNIAALNWDHLWPWLN